jgi:N-acyl amino acid synthase of PEP-CTERM/exosortase system
LLEPADIFSRFFESRLASAPAEIEQALRVRYQVYCEEAAYFDPDQFPDRLERDPFDGRSIQSTLVYRPTNAAVGAVRLILPAKDTDSLIDFPFDSVCPPERLQDLKVPRETSAEISRFCLTRNLAEEIVKTDPADFEALRAMTNGHALEPRQFIRTAKLGLFRAVVEMSVLAGVTHWWAVMEPRLVRSLEKIGVHFVHLGEPVDYYGSRQPCYAEVETVLRRLRIERHDVWRVSTDDGRLATV